MAERIIVELREKIAESLDEAALAAEGGSDEPRSLAREGLVNLGYTPAEAEELMSGASGESAEDLISAALRRAAGRHPRRIAWGRHEWSGAGTAGERPEHRCGGARARRRRAPAGGEEDLDRSLRPRA